MYTVKIKEQIIPHKQVTVESGDPMLLEDGSIMQFPREDANGLVLDENGDMIMDTAFNVNPQAIQLAILKTEQELAAEKQTWIDAKIADINAKMMAYEAGKQNQSQNGGPAPVADEEILKICNEYNCQFEVIWDE